MAKGVEDCAFYRYSRLTSLNEVGADPSVFSMAVADFHATMTYRQAEWPDAMTTLSTHDTKRSEDVRARIAVLAEAPERWAAALAALLDAAPIPDPGFANLLWQAAYGAWPISRERLHAYAEKAMRESGARTTWTDPDEEFEAAVHAAVDAAYDDERVHAVLESLDAELGEAGRVNALSAKLLSLTLPGVPDVYQGSELGDLSLVDPDNRRPVDFDAAEAVAGRRLQRQAAAHRAGPAAAPRPARAVLVVHAAAGRGPGGGARARLRPRRRGDRGDPAAARPGRARRLGRHRARAAGRHVAPGRGAARRRHRGAARAGRPRTVHRGGLVTGSPQRGPFDVWAPRVGRMLLSVGGDTVPMVRGEDDWWSPEGLDLIPRRRDYDYGYLIDDEDTPRPDPRSRRQPAGVHQRSRTHDPSRFFWSDQAWTGRQLAGAVIYELHVGTFTPMGTFDAALTRLDHLRSIGVDFVELMPVNAVNGVHNWGYDGVLWYAVHEPYGGPEGYQRFVDGCHAAGLGVIQDVVYNHLGPSGNYLPEFGPYLKEGANSWGDSVNLDGDGSAEVRRYIIDNARMWLEDYHVDGLRLDAVHALDDSSKPHLLEELAVEVAALVGAPAPAADADRRVRPQRPGADHAARGGRLRPGRPVERRLPPRRPRGAHGRDARLLRRLRAADRAGQGVRGGVLPRRDPLLVPRPRTTGRRSTPRRCRRGGWWSAARTTTRSATGRPATGSPRRWTSTS